MGESSDRYQQAAADLAAAERAYAAAESDLIKARRAKRAAHADFMNEYFWATNEALNRTLNRASYE